MPKIKIIIYTTFIDDDDSGKNYKTANKIGIKRRIIPNQEGDVKRLLSKFKINI